ncbi:MAG: ferrous iron transport protein B [Desulfovibrionaceae bacterium]
MKPASDMRSDAAAGQRSVVIALAGQPNAGKSTVFNMLTGARQHVANYPGVTVEKKSGFFKAGELRAQLVDLPGTYSLTSYSLEERVARQFILEERPDLIVNVVDASNLKRNLYLTLQLLEFGVPLVLNLNMMDVARGRNMDIDVEALSRGLGVPVVPTVGRKSEGREPLCRAIRATSSGGERQSFHVDYGPMEPAIESVRGLLAGALREEAGVPLRWLAVKLLEGDAEARALTERLCTDADAILAHAEADRRLFEEEHKESLDRHVAVIRHMKAAEVTRTCLRHQGERTQPLSDRIDRFVCHRWYGPTILLAILLCLYEISVVWGGEVAGWFWGADVSVLGFKLPFHFYGWNDIEALAESLLPAPGALADPLIRSLGQWVVKSITAILNYLPIFLILFALIAALEDSGYMPRMAFILDRLFRRFGLHGQSTLPMILGGVYVGGCAIPGVMATKAIPDERARFATILIVPLMNCLAKVPLYLILISAYFPENQGMAMFFIATVTLFMALPVAKLLTMTVLKGRETAPFIMEMPPYHLPTLMGVTRRAVERVWLFLKKIVTVVAAVAVIVFALIQFPGLPAERQAEYGARWSEAVEGFFGEMEGTDLGARLAEANGGDHEATVLGIILFGDDLKAAKRGVTDQEEASAINARFEEQNPLYAAVVRRDGKEGKLAAKALKKADRTRADVRREMRTERFENSFLGRMGRAIEPVTQYAGFNWRINIALLSAFAAKENAAATLGSIYGIDGSGSGGEAVQESMRAGEVGFTALHALALMLFMALYPPCIPTTIMVRMQTGSGKWMAFSIIYPMVLGLGVAVLVFSGGSLLGFTGTQAMWTFYGLAVAATLVMGALPNRAQP